MGAGWGQGVGAGVFICVCPLVAANHILHACTTQGGFPAPLPLPVPQGSVQAPRGGPWRRSWHGWELSLRLEGLHY